MQSDRFRRGIGKSPVYALYLAQKKQENIKKKKQEKKQEKT